MSMAEEADAHERSTCGMFPAPWSNTGSMCVSLSVAGKLMRTVAIIILVNYVVGYALRSGTRALSPTEAPLQHSDGASLRPKPRREMLFNLYQEMEPLQAAVYLSREPRERFRPIGKPRVLFEGLDYSFAESNTREQNLTIDVSLLPEHGTLYAHVFVFRPGVELHKEGSQALHAVVGKRG